MLGLARPVENLSHDPDTSNSGDTTLLHQPLKDAELQQQQTPAPQLYQPIIAAGPMFLVPYILKLPPKNVSHI